MIRECLELGFPGCSNSANAGHGLSPQILVEPINRVLPSLLRGGFVVTRCRVVVKAMVGPVVDMTFMGDLGFGERGVERDPPAGDAGIDSPIAH